MTQIDQMLEEEIRVTQEMIDAGNVEMKRMLSAGMVTLGPASPRTLEAVYKAMRKLEPKA